VLITPKPFAFGFGCQVEPQHLSDHHWDFASVRPRMEALVDQKVGIGAAPADQASDLRPFSLRRHNQQNTNSCVAQAMTKAAEIKRVALHGKAAHVDLSPMAVYYLARELQGDTSKDSGTRVSLGAEAMRRFGVCQESEWRFSDQNGVVTSHLFDPPPWSVMRSAYMHKITAWYLLRSSGDELLRDVRANLLLQNPVVFAMHVDDGLRHYKAGTVLTSVEDTGVNHCQVIIGYDPKRDAYLVEGSWGRSWADDGCLWVGPAVLTDSSFDFVSMAAGPEGWASS